MAIDEKLKIIIAGDFSPIGRTEKLFLVREYNKVYGDVLSELKENDIIVTNLETPLTTERNPLMKTGPCLHANPETIEGIKFAGFNVLTLANNHILDQGERGLLKTLDICSSSKIQTVGAGKNISEATQPLIIERKGKKVAILNFAENEFSIATENTAGANPLNVVDNYYQLYSVKDKSDVVLVIIHGGHELYNLPSPRMQDISRFFVDIGANAIIWHHAHIFSGVEMYKNIPIFYGLGNFIFDLPNVKFNRWHEGYLVKLIIDENNSVSYDLIPYKRNEEFFGIRLLNENEKELFKKEISELSEIIRNREILNEKWECYARKLSNSYLSFLTVRTRITRFLLKLSKIRKFLLEEKRILAILNFIRCESHRDVLVYTLEKYLKDINEKE